MADTLTYVSSAVLAITFAWSATYKLVRPSNWRAALEIYGLGAAMGTVAWVLVPLAELAVVALLLVGAVGPGGALAAGLLAAFCAGLLRARAREGDRLPCGCFGGRERKDYRLLLLRNVMLLAPAAWLMTSARGGDPSSPSAADALPATLVVVGLIVIGWTGTQAFGAMRQRGDR